jgi:hypothetical protein
LSSFWNNAAPPCPNELAPRLPVFAEVREILWTFLQAGAVQTFCERPGARCEGYFAPEIVLYWACLKIAAINRRISDPRAPIASAMVRLIPSAPRP